jgi:lipoprotein NlpD
LRVSSSAASTTDNDTVPTVPSTVPTRTPRVETRPLETNSGGGSTIDNSTVAVDGLGVRWSWPATGPLLSGFGDKSSKGVSIAGRAGDPVTAAADGKVVYAGSGLRGYGNLVIVKHANDYLTAYAHNQSLLVKEDQSVRRGQKIAEMGSVDAERVKLHFELRRQGKPLDPMKYLPARN